MDRERFWECISHIDRQTLSNGEGYDHAAIEPLIDCLSMLSPADIQGFEEQLSQALYEIDSEENMRNSGLSSSSSDGFLYARCFVVANGKDSFEAVKTDPKRMPKTLDEWCQPILYAAAKAWENSVADRKWDFFASVSYETGMNRQGWRTLAHD